MPRIGLIRLLSASFVAVVVIGLAALPAQAQHDEMPHATAAQPHAAAPAGDPYMLATDPVTGEKLGTNPVIVQHEGRELRFANEQNAAKFKADAKTYLAKLDKEMIAQQLPLYPLTTCVVSGEKLGGDMGEPVNLIFNNRLVRYCCDSCPDKLTASPAEYLKKLDAAVVAAQKKDYKLTNCPVSGDKLGDMGEPVDFVIGNRLVRLCCKDCIEKMQKDPATYLSKLPSR